MTKATDPARPPEAALSVSERMTMLRDQLVLIFLDEANPKSWPGTETQQQRGDRVWHKKSAEATGRLAARAFHLATLTAMVGSTVPGDEEAEAAALDRLVREMEKEATRLVGESASRLEARGVAILDRRRRRAG